MPRDFVIVEWDDPGGTEWIAPFHVHHADDEAWHVLAGSLRFRVGAETVDAPAGTTVFVEKGTPHASSVVAAQDYAGGGSSSDSYSRKSSCTSLQSPSCRRAISCSILGVITSR